MSMSMDTRQDTTPTSITRCPTCGHRPSQPCCEVCHRIQRQLEATPLWATRHNHEIVPARTAPHNPA